jgi:curved DNA-binding protein
LDDIFGSGRRGKSFSFRIFSQGFGGPRGVRFGGPRGINLEEIFVQAQQPPRREVQYEITLTKEQAAQGIEKDLKRRGKTLRVKIPAGVKTGSKVRLRNARQITNGQAGDIMVLVKVK